MLNFVIKCRILHLECVLGTSWHFNYHLVTQFHGPHFPTLPTSVVPRLWLLPGLQILYVYVLALSACFWVIRSLC
ncbi:hypothetical protein HanRHA438_Chr04g0183081 [Helianthus annuus]|nr:hypothetical protein HanRHA438_Chr04g0183081 [Helianthus annuus]